MSASDRDYSLIDKFCIGVDQIVRTLADNAKTTGKPNPAVKTEEALLNDRERKHSAALMRINHAGEVCAQALYHGQAIGSRCSKVQVTMREAALEEGDHLAWCKQRIHELGSHTSYLNPLWYAGSFCIGMTAGMIGDKWSLGFVAETETQVIKHLESHLEKLPIEDERSFKILKQMKIDEAKHREEAIHAGAHELPPLIKKAMTVTSKMMVKLTYYV